MTRVFSKSATCTFICKPMSGGATAQPLVAFVTFYRGQDEGVRNAADAGDRGHGRTNSKAVPLKFSVSLAKLPPGEYNCQVTVLDPTEQKAAFWQAPVMLIP